MSPEASLRSLRLQRIEKRWPVSAWDYHRLSRWISFDEGYGTSVLALGLFFAASYLDILLLWPQGSSPLLGIDKLGESPPGRVLLVVLLLLNAWIFNRLLAARIPADRKERTWLRLTRLVAAAIPLVGLAIFLLWRRLVRSTPAWAFLSRPEASLRLHGTLPENLGPAQFRSATDVWLKTWSQRRMAQIPWLIACQITPLFSGLHLISKRHGLAVAVCVLLHLAGACAALAHVRLRIPRLQMTAGRALSFRLLPLALLLPVPFSIAVALLWLPAAEESRENKEVVETLYRKRKARRHILAALQSPRQDEITGAREHSRTLAGAAKISLLALESFAFSSLTASAGFPLLSLEAVSTNLLTLLVFLPALPGAALLLAGAAGRLSRWPRLAPFVNHPAAGPLLLVPLVFLFGILGGMALMEDLTEDMTKAVTESEKQPLVVFLKLTGILGFLVSLLSGLWFYALNLLFNRPERAYTRQVTFAFSFCLLLLLSCQLAQPTILLGVATFGTLAGPLAGIVIAARCLAPLRLGDLRDRRLPLRLRRRLGLMALTAILPLGGLALPWWGEVRHRYRSEIDRQAARLRELDG